MTEKTVPLGQFLDGLANRLSAAEAGLLSAEARIAALEDEVRARQSPPETDASPLQAPRS